MSHERFNNFYRVNTYKIANAVFLFCVEELISINTHSRVVRTEDIKESIDKYFLKTYDKLKTGDNRMKKKVFISHISEEKELAELLKRGIEKKFLGVVEVFVSSDGYSIETGKMWLGQITNALNNADAMIALCSKDSVLRPWVNFEMGAGWMKGINVIPACHTNMTIQELPSPINSLQAVTISNKYGLDKVFEVLAKSFDLDMNNPVIRENEELLSKINKFERKNSIEDNLLMIVDNLFAKVPRIKNIFLEGGKGGVYDLLVTDYEYNANKDLFAELLEMRIAEIAVSEKNGPLISSEGFQLVCKVKLMKRHEQWRRFYENRSNS